MSNSPVQVKVTIVTYPTPWEKYDSSMHGIYGAEAQCWEHALFDANGNQVGNSVRGRVSLPGRSEHEIEKYGLTRYQRQVKKFTPKVRKPEEKSMQMVTINHRDRDGNLIRFTREERMVYVNSNGPFIKTRSEGNVKITYPDTMTIEYRESPRTISGNTYWYMRPVLPKTKD